MPRQRNQKIEAGTLYRVDAGDNAAIKGSVWFRGCLTDGSLVLCMGVSNQGVDYLLVEVTREGVRAAGLGKGDTRQLAQFTAKPMGLPTTTQPTRREFKYLDAGDTLRGEFHRGLLRELGVTVPEPPPRCHVLVAPEPELPI